MRNSIAIKIKVKILKHISDLSGIITQTKSRECTFYYTVGYRCNRTSGCRVSVFFSERFFYSHSSIIFYDSPTVNLIFVGCSITTIIILIAENFY